MSNYYQLRDNLTAAAAAYELAAAACKGHGHTKDRDARQVKARRAVVEAERQLDAFLHAQ